MEERKKGFRSLRHVKVARKKQSAAKRKREKLLVEKEIPRENVVGRPTQLICILDVLLSTSCQLVQKTWQGNLQRERLRKGKNPDLHPRDRLMVITCNPRLNCLIRVAVSGLIPSEIEMRRRSHC